MLGRPIILLSLFLLPLPRAQAIAISHERDDARCRELAEEYPDAGRILPNGLPSVLIAPRRVLKDDVAFTIVFDDRERDKISWIRVRSLPR